MKDQEIHMQENEASSRPRVATDEHMAFLDSLSKRVDNMYVADAIMVDEFGLTLEDARLVLRHWPEWIGRRSNDNQ